MPGSRREFLSYSSIGMLVTALRSGAQMPAGQAQELPPGAPPAFGTAPPVGPEVSPATFAEAQKLVQVQMTDTERAQAAQNWRESMAALYERRTGPRKVALSTSLAPYSQCNPVLPGHYALPSQDRFVRSSGDPGKLPGTDTEIAFAPVWKLSRWVESRQLSS